MGVFLSPSEMSSPDSVWAHFASESKPHTDLWMVWMLCAEGPPPLLLSWRNFYVIDFLIRAGCCNSRDSPSLTPGFRGGGAKQPSSHWVGDWVLGRKHYRVSGGSQIPL